MEFGNANVSNLSETLVERNEDHLLNRGRTDLAKKRNSWRVSQQVHR